MSLKMALFVARIVFTSSIRSIFWRPRLRGMSTYPVRSVSSRSGKEREPDVVRRDGRHPGPLEALGQVSVHPRVARGDLHVAVECAGLVGQEPVGHRLPS